MGRGRKNKSQDPLPPVGPAFVRRPVPQKPLEGPEVRPSARSAPPPAIYPNEVLLHREDDPGAFDPDMRQVSMRPQMVGDMPELFPAITHPKQRAFLCAFAALGIKEEAARVANLDLRYHRVWLSTDVAYSTAFAEAEQVLADRMEDALMQRGVEGYEEDVYFMGMPVGSRKKFSDHLVSFALPFLKPERYGKKAAEQEGLSDGMAALLAEWESKPAVPSLPAAATGDVLQANGEVKPPWELHPSLEATANELAEEGEGPEEEVFDEEAEPEEPGFIDDDLDTMDNPYGLSRGRIDDYEEEGID